MPNSKKPHYTHQSGETEPEEPEEGEIALTCALVILGCVMAALRG